MQRLIAIGLAGALTVGALGPVWAAPMLSSTAALKAAAPSDVIQVRSGRRAALGIGIAAGVIAGAAIAGAASGYYGPGYYYAPGYYAAPAYAYEPAPAYAYEPAPVYVAPSPYYGSYWYQERHFDRAVGRDN